MKLRNFDFPKCSPARLIVIILLTTILLTSNRQMRKEHISEQIQELTTTMSCSFAQQRWPTQQDDGLDLVTHRVQSPVLLLMMPQSSTLRHPCMEQSLMSVFMQETTTSSHPQDSYIQRDSK